MDDNKEKGLDTYKLLMDAVRKRVEDVKTEHAVTSTIVVSKIENPVKQKNDKQELRTCLVAVSINAMKALGYPNPPSEQEMVEELTLIEPPSDTGELRVQVLFDYLKSKGFTSKSVWGYPKQLVDGLLEGNCTIQIVPSKSIRFQSHATLLAGIRIDRGNISLIEYDPDPKEPEIKEYTLEEQVDKLYQPEVMTGLWLISRNPEAE